MASCPEQAESAHISIDDIYLSYHILSPRVLLLLFQLALELNGPGIPQGVLRCEDGKIDIAI
jgi:hypothetical protein